MSCVPLAGRESSISGVWPAAGITCVWLAPGRPGIVDFKYLAGLKSSMSTVWPAPGRPEIVDTQGLPGFWPA